MRELWAWAFWAFVVFLVMYFLLAPPTGPGESTGDAPVYEEQVWIGS